jgi:hypothetical protein
MKPRFFYEIHPLLSGPIRTVPRLSFVSGDMGFLGITGRLTSNLGITSS